MAVECLVGKLNSTLGLMDRKSNDQGSELWGPSHKLVPVKSLFKILAPKFFRAISLLGTDQTKNRQTFDFQRHCRSQ
jgi:hypothetical protein